MEATLVLGSSPSSLFPALVEEDSFRLLRILPGFEKDDIHGELVTTSVSREAGKYIALSYTWGSDRPTKPITLNDTAFDIRENLHDFLKLARKINEPVILWVDAICINQNSSSERTHQVGLMAEVYGQAAGVDIWLGSGSEQLYHAMEIIERLGTDKSLHLDPRCGPAVFKDNGEENEQSTIIAAFFNVAWWSRVWTLQEYVLARKRTFYCGTRKIDGRVVEECANNAMSHYESCCSQMTSIFYRPHHDKVHLADGLINIGILREYKNQQPPTLLGTLGRFDFKLATNPRDRLYGFLGIVKQNGHSFMDALYDCTLQQTCAEVVRRWLKVYGNLDFLWHVGDYPSFTTQSFVPNWTERRPLHHERWDCDRRWHLQSAYDASAGRRAELDVEVDGTARFAGLNVDVIKAKTDSYHTDFAGTLLEAQDISGFNRSPHHTYQPTGESVHDAFAITMTGGLQAGGEKREHVDENLLTWMKWILDCRVNHWHIPGGSTQDKLDINSAHLFFRAAVFGRSFIVTEKGYFGFAPSTFYFDRDDYVRLLSLSPGEFDEPIVCDLKIASIAHLPQHFEALSYCWGDQRDRKPIILRGTEYLATASLITALRHLRYADRPRTLWVDALCINQEDTAELSHQILHMRNIYSQATRVLAWVGTEEWNPKAAFDAIRRRAEKAAVLDEASLAALYHFLSSPYWERLWVVQELALARDIAIVCGREILPWKAIDQLMAPDAAGRRLPDGLPYHMRKGLWKVRHLWHTRTVLHSPDRSLNFLQVLNKFNPCLCYLAKDKVYATLGMSSDVVRRIVRPDYTDSTTTEDVFRQATIACISEQKNLDVLALTRRWTEYGEFQVSGDEPKPPVSRVSWAGEWSTVRIIRPLIEPDDTVKAYAAAPCDGFDVEEATRHGNRGLLKLKGVLLDMLNHVEELPNPYLDGWEERTIAWEPKGLDTYEYPTGENGVDAFWRTLLFDMAYSTFHPVHERLTKEEAPRYRQLYLEWTGRSESSTNENSFSNCLRWGVNFSSLHGWTFAVTETGYFVRTQPEAEPGDVVAFVSGSAVPLILRATQNLEVGYAHGSSDVGGQRLWRLVGSGYVHGMMDGEAFDKNPPDVVDILLV